VEANSTGGQGSRRAVAPSDDDDDDVCTTRVVLRFFKLESCTHDFLSTASTSFVL
jgi:hypothetical protein